MDFQDVKIDREYFVDLYDHTAKNEDIAQLYDMLYDETGDLTHQQHAAAMRVCVKFWETDYYRIQKVKDIKRVNLCRDKFCLNCQSMLAIKRQTKYAPMLDTLFRKYQVCHAVFTVPNMPGEELLPMLDTMYKKFKYLTRYLSGDKHIRGIDFSQYGYAGGLRALEVTYNAEEKTFHPHFHVALLLKKGITFERKYINSYSFGREGESCAKFTELEILLQKLWYLLINGITVTKESIESLKEGYSVIVNKAMKGKYHELFKYACKGAFKEGSIYNPENFRALYYALKNRRMIQGYGVLHNFKDAAADILEEDLESCYRAVIAKLCSFEDPVPHIETLDEVMDQRDCAYISKSSLKRILLERRKEESE